MGELRRIVCQKKYFLSILLLLISNLLLFQYFQNDTLELLKDKDTKSTIENEWREEQRIAKKEFLENIPENDIIIFLTARSQYEKAHTLRFLEKNHVRYDHIIFGAGQGERILINDNKPDGLTTAIAINTTRDRFCQTEFITDHNMGTMYD